MLNTRGHFLTGIKSQSFLSERAALYADSNFQKCGALGNYVGILDGTVIGIARPSQSMWQRIAYNGHKRKHTLKFQSLTTPDGLVLDAFGPLEGRKETRLDYVY